MLKQIVRDRERKREKDRGRERMRSLLTDEQSFEEKREEK
jgi:hypothetical protein